MHPKSESVSGVRGESPTDVRTYVRTESSSHLPAETSSSVTRTRTYGFGEGGPRVGAPLPGDRVMVKHSCDGEVETAALLIESVDIINSHQWLLEVRACNGNLLRVVTNGGVW